MNVLTAPSRTPSPTVVPFAFTPRPAPRERDFGIGYGKSSGYATGRRYTVQSNAPRLFRFA